MSAIQVRDGFVVRYRRWVLMVERINGYCEQCYQMIPINDKSEIRVLTSERISDNSMLVDIRKYSLYGNTFDNVKRPTKKGIKFRLSNIQNIICGLVDILVSANMLERTEADMVKALIK